MGTKRSDWENKSLTESQLARLYDARYRDGISFEELEERFGFDCMFLERHAKMYAKKNNLPTPRIFGGYLEDIK